MILRTQPLWCCLLAAAPRQVARQARSLHRLQACAADYDCRGASSAARGAESSLAALADELQLGTILSPANAKIKLMRRLNSRRQRERSGMILLEGHRCVY